MRGNYQILEKSDADYSETATALDGAFAIVSDTVFLQIGPLEMAR